MQLIQARISQTQVIPLSEHWQKLILFVRSHPYIKFENLVFKEGEPVFGDAELKMSETVKF